MGFNKEIVTWYRDWRGRKMKHHAYFENSIMMHDITDVATGKMLHHDKVHDWNKEVSVAYESKKRGEDVL